MAFSQHRRSSIATRPGLPRQVVGHRSACRPVIWPSCAAVATIAAALAASLGSVALAQAAGATTAITIHADRPVAIVPAGLYGVGYNGWGDITQPSAVAELKAVRVRFCRIDVNLHDLCGKRLGDFHWEYTTPRDQGLGFVDRVRRIIADGWTPILALSTSFALPSWFHGSPTDAGGATPWFRYNLDGTLTAKGSVSDQYEELTRVTRALAAGLARRGLGGLYWETIYEMGASMPMPDIHYYAARGLREGDPTAKLMGPATWPGWTVEERFVKPYLAKYGPDLLDFVTLHWYASNEHAIWDLPLYKARKGIVCMDDRKSLAYIMETAPKYAAWCRSLRKLLDDPAVNPTGKHIGVVFTEFDANANSPFGHDPANPDWPRYDPAADCYINTNWFGGVWCASVLCGMAATGCLDIACKFNTRQYYGLIDNGPKGYFRQPVWFAWKLLQEEGGLVPGARMVAATVRGPADDAAADVGGKDTPWVGAYAVGGTEGLRVILINRSAEARKVSLRIEGLAARLQEQGRAAGGREGLLAVRYLYSQERLAPFIGRKPGSKAEGAFEGSPEDSLNERCLKPVGEVDFTPTTAATEGGGAEIGAALCPPISITVLILR